MGQLPQIIDSDCICSEIASLYTLSQVASRVEDRSKIQIQLRLRCYDILGHGQSPLSACFCSQPVREVACILWHVTSKTKCISGNNAYLMNDAQPFSNRLISLPWQKKRLAALLYDMLESGAPQKGLSMEIDKQQWFVCQRFGYENIYNKTGWFLHVFTINYRGFLQIKTIIQFCEWLRLLIGQTQALLPTGGSSCHWKHRPPRLSLAWVSLHGLGEQGSSPQTPRL